MTTRRKWLWIIIGCVAAVAVAVFVVPRFIPNAAFACGRFDVPITVYRDGTKLGPDEIERVSFFHYIATEKLRDDIWDEEYFENALDEAPLDNGAYIAKAPCSRRISFTGREFNYYQPDALYVEVKLKNGCHIRLLCPLAHKDTHPEIRIDVGE